MHMAHVQAGFAVVTPASRGLGFAFAKQLLVHTDLPLVVTARRDCAAVRDSLLYSVQNESQAAEDRLHVLQVDVTDESTIAAMASEIRRLHPQSFMRLAITLPGVLHVEKSPAQIDANSALESFKVNSLGPMLLMKHLSPFLPTKSSPPFGDAHTPSHVLENHTWRLPSSHGIYAMMAARVGSISDNASGGWYSYRASKAAVFQLAKTFDLFLRSRSKDRAIAMAMHPGTVQTDFTRDYWSGREMLHPDQSARKLLEILCGMGTGINDGRGRCWDWKGEEVLP